MHILSFRFVLSFLSFFQFFYVRYLFLKLRILIFFRVLWIRILIILVTGIRICICTNVMRIHNTKFCPVLCAMKKEGKMAIVSIEYGTLAIEVGSFFYFAVVFFLTCFFFLKYRQIRYVNRQGAPNCSVRFPVLN